MIDEQHRKPHWKQTVRLALLSFAILVCLTFVLPLFSEFLDGYRILGFPLGYFMVTNGCIFGLILLLFWHSGRQDKIDRQHGASENI